MAILLTAFHRPIFILYCIYTIDSNKVESNLIHLFFGSPLWKSQIKTKKSNKSCQFMHLEHITITTPTHRGLGRLSAGLEVAVVVLLVGEAQAAGLTKAGRLAGVAAHVGHQQQGRAEAFPTLGTFQHPLVRAHVSLHLLQSVESLSALQTSDLVPFCPFVWPVCLVPIPAAPAARVLLMLLKVPLAGELPQTGHAVDALGLAVVLAVQSCQAEVAAAPYAGIRQQAEVAEAVFEQSSLGGEGLCAVRAPKYRMTRLLLQVARQGLFRHEIRAASLTFNHHLVVCLHVAFTVVQDGKQTLAQVALVVRLLKVSFGDVAFQIV